MKSVLLAGNRGTLGKLASILVAGGLLLAASNSHGDEAMLQAEIDRAAKLHVTAAWQESQRLIDALKPRLYGATPRQRAQVAIMEARNLALGGDYRAGLDILQSLLTQPLDADQRFRARELGSNLAMLIDEFELAFELLKQALEQIGEIEDAGQQSGLFGLATYWHAQVGSPRQAMEYGQRSLELARLSGDQRALCTALEKYGRAADTAGLPELAVQTYLEAIQVCDQAGDPVFAGAVRLLLANTIMDQGDPGAESWITAGRALLEASGYHDGIMNARIAHARALGMADQWEAATALLDGVADDLAARERWDRLAETYRLLASAAAWRGDHAQAMHWLESHVQARERFLDYERAKLVAFYGVEFQTSLREHEIGLLSERNRVLELQREARQRQQLMIGGGAAALAIIGVLLLLLLLRAAAERRELRRLSERDSLTGLNNHSAFFRRAEQALATTRENGQPLVLALADIDHFKQINDRHGHVFGDAALSVVARHLQEAFGNQGVVGRLGGEEFGVVLVGHDGARAMARIEAVRQQLGLIEADGQQAHVTLSFGLAEAHAHSSVESLRSSADKALYAAKTRGRNQMVDSRSLALKTAPR